MFSQCGCTFWADQELTAKVAKLRAHKNFGHMVMFVWGWGQGRSKRIPYWPTVFIYSAIASANTCYRCFKVISGLNSSLTCLLATSSHAKETWLIYRLYLVSVRLVSTIKI